MLSYQTVSQTEYGISIVGIGGAGANVLQCFGSSSAEHVRLFTMSLDERVGRAGGNVKFIQLGEALSHGLGSGGDPEVGRHAMEESSERVKEVLENCKLLVMVVGLGGGTGSGAAPVLAQMAREAGVFLVSVIMMPFSFEGKRRRAQADSAMEEIARLSDIVFCFENDYMEELFRNRSGARAVFEEVDRLLAKATASVPMMASSPGLINLGLDELASALQNRDSRCIFGSGSGYGKDRAVQAARSAVESPLTAYHGALRLARAVIAHIAGGESLSLTEIRQAMETVRGALGGDEVDIFFGATVKPHLGDELRITLIASIDAEEFKAAILQEEEEAAAARAAAEEEARQAAAQPPAPESSEEDTAAADPEPEEEQQFVDEEENFPPREQAEPQEPDSPVEEEEEEEEEPPAPRPAAAPAPAEPKEAPQKAPQPTPAPRPVEQSPAPQAEPPRQLDLFSGPPMRQVEPADLYAPQQPRNSRSELPSAVGSYTPGGVTRQRVAVPEDDDFDKPPAMRFNDLRDIFPDN